MLGGRLLSAYFRFAGQPDCALFDLRWTGTNFHTNSSASIVHHRTMLAGTIGANAVKRFYNIFLKLKWHQSLPENITLYPYLTRAIIVLHF